MAKVIAVCISEEKGQRKTNIHEGNLIVGRGLENDAHAGDWHRQVSLLALESIEKMQHLGLDVNPGDFAENITTHGIDLLTLPIGSRFKIGRETLLRVTQIGKECHTKCAIYYQAGDCVMPKEGIFAEVLVGGHIKVEDEITFASGYKLGIITVSDKGSRGEREDKSGEVIMEKLKPFADVADYRIVPDEAEDIEKAIKEMADEMKVDLILTTGGTGFSPRDITPEVTLSLCDRVVPGIPEAMRAASYKITPKAMLSRAAAGIRKQTLIINLPGSPKAVSECLDVVLPVLDHGLEILTGKGGECAT